LKESGEYKIIIKDSLGASMKKTFIIIPGKVEKLDINL